jgi:hypothetical protein
MEPNPTIWHSGIRFASATPEPPKYGESPDSNGNEKTKF